MPGYETDWKADGLTPDQRVDRFVNHWRESHRHGGIANLDDLKRELRGLVHFAIAEHSTVRLISRRSRKDHGHED